MCSLPLPTCLAIKSGLWYYKHPLKATNNCCTVAAVLPSHIKCSFSLCKTYTHKYNAFLCYFYTCMYCVYNNMTKTNMQKDENKIRSSFFFYSVLYLECMYVLCILVCTHLFYRDSVVVFSVFLDDFFFCCVEGKKLPYFFFQNGYMKFAQLNAQTS